MRAIVHRLKKLWLLRQAIFAVSMAIFIYACVAFQFHPRTPFGKQCPTAPVQRVATEVSCCGTVIGYEYRQPVPGEPEFVQCQCAEKSSTVHTVSMAPKLEPYLPLKLQVITRAFVVPAIAPPTLLVLAYDWSEPPLIRPPIHLHSA